MNSEFYSGPCTEFETKLEDFLGGELSGAEKREVSGHLEGCPACKSAVEVAGASSRLLSFMDASADPGPAFARIVMARIRSEEAARESRGFWQPFVFLAWRFAATAALALVVMVTYDVRLHQAGGVSVQQSDIHDLFTTDADRAANNPDDVLIPAAEDNHGSN
jgi:anti-sigma factor RsiW